MIAPWFLVSFRTGKILSFYFPHTLESNAKSIYVLRKYNIASAVIFYGKINHVAEDPSLRGRYEWFSAVLVH